ncbi:MAG: riboflavin synthase [Algisphaera sp.]
MFTGIVKQFGKITALEPCDAGIRLTLCTQGAGVAVARGDSVCVSGVCLTALQEAPGQAGATLVFDVVAQTLERTTLGGLVAGDRVNLEPALTAREPLGGHFVQGHVDGVGEVCHVQTASGNWRVRVAIPNGADTADLRAAMVPRGSVTLDGVSLTLADVGDDWIEVALIPETLERTTLGAAKQGTRLNLEADVLAKAVVRCVERMDVGHTHAKKATSQVTSALLMTAGWGADSS